MLERLIDEQKEFVPQLIINTKILPTRPELIRFES
jgi:hypothetical protein